MSDAGGFSLLKDDDNMEVGLTPNQQMRINNGTTHQPRSNAVAASSLEMQAHAALDSCNGLPWKNFTLLYILAGSAFITALVAVNKTPETDSSMSGSQIYSKVACPWGDLTWGDEVFQFDGHEHSYQIIGSKNAQITWRQAAMDANNRCYGGQPGYLVNIDSEDENDYIYAKLLKKIESMNANTANHYNAWIGATDMKNEGAFSWIGPKHLITGTKFWEGDGDGQAIDGRYTNWYDNEPSSEGEEDCVEMRGGQGFWNDRNCYEPNSFFIVEFGDPLTDH